MTATPIMIRPHRTVSKNLEKRMKEIENRGTTETVQITALLRLVRII